MVLPLVAAFCAFAILAYRWPTLLLLIALASYAVAVEAFITETGQDREVAQLAGLDIGPLQKGVLLAALAVNALHYGIRLRMNWPLLAVVVLLIQGLLFADLHRGLTVVQMIRSAVSLVLPWSTIHVVLQRGTRQLYAFVIASIPLLSMVLGLLLQLAGTGEVAVEDRFGGASISAFMSYMGFAGFAIALHESFRRTHVYFVYLAFINLALVVMAGGRMGLFASIVMFVGYAMFSKTLRHRLGTHAKAFILGGCAVALVLLIYLPFLQQRIAGDATVEVPMTNRDVIWSYLFDEFMVDPILGRGVGAGAVAALYGNLPARGAHNEYLRLLLDGGVVGFVIYYAAVALWVKQFLKTLNEDDRAFTWAVILALAVYATTDNVLTSGPVMPLYVYFTTMLGTRRMEQVPEAGKSRRARRRARAPETAVDTVGRHDRAQVSVSSRSKRASRSSGSNRSASAND